MNLKNAINKRAAQARKERERLYNIAVREYLENGYTRRFRKLWRAVVSLDEEQNWIKNLEMAKSTSLVCEKNRKIGFDGTNSEDAVGFEVDEDFEEEYEF